MTMFEFMTNAFYMLAGVACVAITVLILYCVAAAIARGFKGGNKNGKTR
ncbi:hypothetical protein UNSWDHB_2659 [Dehalobacter sp. UNSWDHB]|nr:hypothetical protein UNSWDHB_2659 [Dehalobacter sp. UNSWDHB]